jgi:hypothetical protein
LFVANLYGDTISQYTTSGALVNSSLIPDLDNPSAIAISEGNLFVGTLGTGIGMGRIGEYTLAGLPVDSDLITGLTGPNDIEVVSGGVPPVADAASTWLMLLLALLAIVGLRPLFSSQLGGQRRGLTN